MLMIHSRFPRPVNLRSQRFNQHMTSGSLLVEVGTSGNTLQEAIAGARLFAKAAGEVYLGCMEP
jgi:stage II sporulation protein P